MTVLSWLKRTFGDRNGRANGRRYGEAYAADLFVTRLEERRVLTAPTLDAIANPAAINEDAAEQTINLTGITDADGDTQELAISASSDTPGLIPDPTVFYTSNNNTGSLKYTPVADQSGTATITVTVTDGGTDGKLATAGDNETFQRQFSVQVDPVNDDAPVAQNVNVGIGEDDPLTVFAFDADDVDVDDDPTTLTYTIVAPPGAGNGTVTNLNNGKFNFDPAADFQFLAAGETKDVTFTYRATDSNAQDSNVATVKITVTGANDDPTAVDDVDMTDEDTAKAITVLANDSDPDTNDTLTVTLPSALSAQGAAVSVGPGSQVTYNPTAAANLQKLAVGEKVVDNFTYQIDDGNGGVKTAMVSVTVNGVNDDPLPVDDAAATDEDTSTAIDVLANDSDPDATDTLTLSLPSATSTQGAAVTLGPGNQVTYNPTAATKLQALAVGANVIDTFTYQVDDGNGGVKTATVSVAVIGLNDAPVSQNVGVAISEDGPATSFNFNADDIDSDNDPSNLAYSLVTVPVAGNGTLTNTFDGKFTFDPGQDFQDLAAGESRDVVFAYRVTDKHGRDSNISTVTINVTGQNDSPVVASFNLSATEVNEKGRLGITGNLTDADLNDNHTVTIAWGDGTTSSTGNGDVFLDRNTRRFAANHVYADDNPTNTAIDPTNIRVTVSDGLQSSFQDATVNVKDVAPQFVDTFASDVSALGETTVTGVVQDPSFLDTQTLIIDWGDGSPTEVVPLTMSNGVGSFSATHLYFGNPDRANPAANIPILLRVTDDDGLSPTLTIEAAVPGSGLATPTFDVAPPIPTLSFAAVPASEIPSEVLSAPEIAQFISFQSGRGGPTDTGQVRVELRVVSPDDPAKESEGITLNDDNTRAEDVLKDLPRIFKSLPDDHYRIYLIREDGTERLVLDVSLRRNKQIDQDESATQAPDKKSESQKPRAGTLNDRLPEKQSSRPIRNGSEGEPIDTETREQNPEGPRFELPTNALPQTDSATSVNRTGDVTSATDLKRVDSDDSESIPMIEAGFAGWLGITGRRRWQRAVDESVADYARSGFADRRRRLSRLRQSPSDKSTN